MDEQKAHWLESVLSGFVSIIPTQHNVSVFYAITDEDESGVMLYCNVVDQDALVQAFWGTTVSLTMLEPEGTGPQRIRFFASIP